MVDVIKEGQVPALARAARAEGKRIAFVAGVFDIVHAGHAHLLETARASADIVVCGLYDDGSARVLKGPGRPIMPLDDRIAVVSALKSVDALVIIEDPEIDTCIESLRPDVFLFGTDDASQSHVRSGASVVRSHGGVVLPLERTPAISTAAIVQQLAEGVDQPLGRLSPVPNQRLSTTDSKAVVSFSYFVPYRPGYSNERISLPITLRGRAEDDLIFAAIARDKCFYDDMPLRLLAGSTPPDGLVIDVGANIGNHSVFFGAFMARKVLAIEPVPELFELLLENIAANGLDNVIPIQAAAGKEEGWGIIFRPPSSRENAGAIQIRPLPQDTPWSPETVSIRTVDSLLAELGDDIAGLPVTMLKIDVEGSEYAVILGAQETIAKHRPTIFVELTLAETFTAVARALNRLGYRATERFGDVVPSYIFVTDRPTSMKRSTR